MFRQKTYYSLFVFKFRWSFFRNIYKHAGTGELERALVHCLFHALAQRGHDAVQAFLQEVVSVRQKLVLFRNTSEKGIAIRGTHTEFLWDV